MIPRWDLDPRMVWLCKISNQCSDPRNKCGHCSYLPTPSNTKCSNQTISPFPPALAQNTLNQLYSTRALEQFTLSCIFLKDSCKCELLNSAFSVVACRRTDGDVRRSVVVMDLLDVQKALAVGAGRSQAEVDVKEGCTRSVMAVHLLCSDCEVEWN